jgi:hypothetical protein
MNCGFSSYLLLLTFAFVHPLFSGMVGLSSSAAWPWEFSCEGFFKKVKKTRNCDLEYWTKCFGYNLKPRRKVTRVHISRISNSRNRKCISS